MLADQRLRQDTVLPLGPQGFPFLDLFMALKPHQPVEPQPQRRLILNQIGIGPRKVFGASLDRSRDLDPFRLLHRREQARRQVQTSDAARLGLDHHGTVWVEGVNRRRQCALEGLLTGLGAPAAKGGATMIGQPFEIDDLNALAAQRLEDVGFPGPGIAVQQDDFRRHLLVVQTLHHQPAIALIAPFQHLDPPADLPEDRREGSRPLPAPPAIDQRAPAAVFLRQRPFDMRRRVPRHQRGTDLARPERTVLNIDRTDLRTLGIRQNRQADRSRHPVFVVFRRRTHVDHRIETGVGQIGKAGHAECHGVS